MATGSFEESCKDSTGEARRADHDVSHDWRLPQSSRPVPQGQYQLRQDGHARIGERMHSQREASRQKSRVSISLWFLHIDRQCPASPWNDGQNSREQQCGSSKLTAVQQDDSVCPEFCCLFAENRFLKAICNKPGFPIKGDLSEYFMRWRRSFCAIYTDVFAFSGRTRGASLGTRDASGIAAAQRCERKAGQDQGGGASCARFHARQDAKDSPLRDSPSMRNCGLTLMRRHQMGP